MKIFYLFLTFTLLAVLMGFDSTGSKNKSWLAEMDDLTRPQIHYIRP